MSNRQTMPTAAIRVGPRFRKSAGDLTSLAHSMDRLGMLQPIVVSNDGELIAGLRRLRAAQQLEWDLVPVRVVALDEPLLAERDENEERVPFTPSERVAIARAIEAKLGNRQGERTDRKQPRQKIAEVPAGTRTADAAAEQAGFKNRETYRQAAKVVDHATPEVVEAMDDGTLSISDAAVIADADAETQRESVSAVKNGESRTAATAARAITDADPGSIDAQIRRERQAVRLMRAALKQFDEALRELGREKTLAKFTADVREQLTALRAAVATLENAVKK